jgi:C-terminal AAA-associated domain
VNGPCWSERVGRACQCGQTSEAGPQLRSADQWVAWADGRWPRRTLVVESLGHIPVPASPRIGTLREGFFLDLLRRGFSTMEARRQLDTAIDWGRYAELFDYRNGELVLERERPAVTG